MIPDSVAFALNAITAAVSTPSVKRFVFTSSSAAVNISIPNNPLTLTTSTWNDAAVQASKAPGPYGPDRIISTYSASKVLAERAVYEYAEANDQFTDLVVNSVLPDFCTGLPLDPAHMGMPSSAGLTKAVFEGEMDYARILGPRMYCSHLSNLLCQPFRSLFSFFRRVDAWPRLGDECLANDSLCMQNTGSTPSM